MSYDDSISPEFYELEREAIFKRAWLNVGRVEQLPRAGSYFTRELRVAQTSIVVVRDTDGHVRAFHNICRHRGNKLVWNDFPREETSGTCRQFTCKYGLQDANTLEATQMILESRAVTSFPLNDQEILCRHLHRMTADWVRDYKDRHATVRGGWS